MIDWLHQNTIKTPTTKTTITTSVTKKNDMYGWIFNTHMKNEVFGAKNEWNGNTDAFMQQLYGMRTLFIYKKTFIDPKY